MQFSVNGGEERKEKKKNLKVIIDRAAMIYTPVAHYYCLFRGERKSLNILLHSHC
jgi:hypothetical protein